MSIKSDKWIRRMAEAHGMIEPFEPGQVRSDQHRRRRLRDGNSCGRQTGHTIWGAQDHTP